MDRREIPKCEILGVQIAAINMSTALNYIQTNLEDLKGQYICISNVHTTVMSYEDTTYCSIQNEAALALPDGKPLFRLSNECGYKHYFYGGKAETLKTLETKLKQQYQLEIAGMYAPPFRDLTEEEDRAVVERINKSGADFVWVALGAPKQERWMYTHQGSIEGLMAGIGAGVDYFAGNIKRAPMWMQKCSLEWLYRLFQEPRRLFKRYLMTNTKFIWLTARGR